MKAETERAIAQLAAGETPYWLTDQFSHRDDPTPIYDELAAYFPVVARPARPFQPVGGAA